MSYDGNLGDNFNPCTGVNARRREKELRRKLARKVRQEIRTRAKLQSILRALPDDAARKRFTDSVRAYLPFKTEPGQEERKET